MDSVLVILCLVLVASLFGLIGLISSLEGE